MGNGSESGSIYSLLAEVIWLLVRAESSFQTVWGRSCRGHLQFSECSFPLLSLWWMKIYCWASEVRLLLWTAFERNLCAGGMNCSYLSFYELSLYRAKTVSLSCFLWVWQLSSSVTLLLLNIFPELPYSEVTHRSFVGLKYSDRRVDQKIFWKVECKTSAALIM